MLIGQKSFQTQTIKQKIHHNVCHLFIVLCIDEKIYHHIHILLLLLMYTPITQKNTLLPHYVLGSLFGKKYPFIFYAAANMPPNMKSKKK